MAARRRRRKKKQDVATPRATYRFSGKTLEAMRYRHWSVINRLLKDNGPTSFPVLLEALRQTGLSYAMASGYLRTEKDCGRLTGERHGQTWVYALALTQHPALTDCQKLGNTTWDAMSSEQRATAQARRIQRHVTDGKFKGRPNILTADMRAPATRQRLRRIEVNKIMDQIEKNWCSDSLIQTMKSTHEARYGKWDWTRRPEQKKRVLRVKKKVKVDV